MQSKVVKHKVEFHPEDDTHTEAYIVECTDGPLYVNKADADASELVTGLLTSDANLNLTMDQFADELNDLWNK